MFIKYKIADAVINRGAVVGFSALQYVGMRPDDGRSTEVNGCVRHFNLRIAYIMAKFGAPVEIDQQEVALRGGLANPAFHVIEKTGSGIRDRRIVFVIDETLGGSELYDKIPIETPFASRKQGRMAFRLGPAPE